MIHAGRRLRVTYTGPSGATAVLVDSVIGPATTALGLAAVQAAKQSLHCDVDVTRHLRPAAQPSTVTVYGLSRARMDTIVSEVAQARELSYEQRTAVNAGMLRIEYGLADQDLTVLAHDAIVDARLTGEGVDRALVIEAVDGRLLWDTLFITESRQPTPDNVAEQAGLSKPPVAQAPAKTRSVTYTLQGAGEADALMVFARLGLAPVYTAEGVRYIAAGKALLLPPLDLSAVIVPPIEPPGAGGVLKVRTLANPGLIAGRQVTLGHVPPKPYRLDEIRVGLSNYAPTWHADLLCRPSA